MVGLTGFEPATTKPPVSVKPCSLVPARPSPPADLQKSSQCISLRPTMFRAACDNSVTTSAARQPTNSKPAHLEMPSGKPDLHQPVRSNRVPCPTTARQRLIAPDHDSPSIRTPHPLRDRPCSSTAPIRHSRACGPQHQCTFRGSAHTNTAPDPDMSTVTTRAANTARPPTIPVPADDGDQYRVLVATPDSPVPGSPTIDRT